MIYKDYRLFSPFQLHPVTMTPDCFIFTFIQGLWTAILCNTNNASLLLQSITKAFKPACIRYKSVPHVRSCRQLSHHCELPDRGDIFFPQCSSRKPCMQAYFNPIGAKCAEKLLRRTYRIPAVHVVRIASSSTSLNNFNCTLHQF